LTDRNFVSPASATSSDQRGTCQNAIVNGIAQHRIDV
jgi:hypothetical protein